MRDVCSSTAGGFGSIGSPLQAATATSTYPIGKYMCPKVSQWDLELLIVALKENLDDNQSVERHRDVSGHGDGSDNEADG